MKLTMIYSGVTGYEQQLDQVSKIISDTLSELDSCEIGEVSLPKLSLPYYNGANADAVADCAAAIRRSKGVIFAATATRFAPNAPMMQWMEHMTDPMYQGLLADKNCLIAVTSACGGERAAADMISRTVAALKGFDVGRIMIGPAYLAAFEDPEIYENIKEMIERQTEDYYRVLRQNRRFFIPAEDALEARPLPANEPDTVIEAAKAPSFKTAALFEKYRLNDFDEKQEQEISEITQLFTQKYTKYTKEETSRQRTQRLPQFFKPGAVNDLTAVIQLIIGAETPETGFEGYLTINGADGECAFHEGQSEHKDITIMSDEKAWADIITGKHTAQKAFMIGQLKVRGNFSFLSKLDQAFDFSMK